MLSFRQKEKQIKRERKKEKKNREEVVKQQNSKSHYTLGVLDSAACCEQINSISDLSCSNEVVFVVAVDGGVTSAATVVTCVARARSLSIAPGTFTLMVTLGPSATERSPTKECYDNMRGIELPPQ